MSNTADVSAAEVVPEELEIADELIAERRSGEPGDLPEDMAPWMASTITGIDVFSLWTGRIVCWLTIPLFSAMVYFQIQGLNNFYEIKIQ